MQLDGIPIQRGQTLFYPHTTPSGNKTWKHGQVIDTNEVPPAVKLEVGERPKLKLRWFDATTLKWKEPPKETPAK